MSSSPTKAAAKETKPLLLAEDNTLRNEFFEAVINPLPERCTNAGPRGNRMSQHRAPHAGGKAKPGAPIATLMKPPATASWRRTASKSAATTGARRITTRRRLLDLEGKKLAGFVQSTVPSAAAAC
jgi:hypothetical protein